jgi:hypothetical protein
MVHAVQRLECVGASAMTTASALHAPSVMILIWPLLKGSLASLLRRWSKILFPILRRLTTIGVDVVHLFRVAALIVVVTRWP